jgi:DDE superfamily endonuclease/Helix-turn-helix of DDE superfamily endonuclease
MNYHQQKEHETNFISLTSLTVAEFEYLFSYFEPLWEKHYRYHTLEGKKRIIVSHKEHGNALLKGSEQKLFFLLVYLKNNPLQTFQAASFGVSQTKVSKIYRSLLPVLDQTLKKMGLSPCRDSARLKQVLQAHQVQVFWLDGTESSIHRNKDDDAQQVDFSGKQHGHRLKNLTICDVFQHIWYLSPTENGSTHDKTIADTYPLQLPEKSILKQDLGFVGHRPTGVIVEEPFKKPKNKELDFSKKVYNKLFNSTRIVVEHANSGLKRLRMLKDVFRIRHFQIRDMVRVVATGLHNLRVKSIGQTRLYYNASHVGAYMSNLSE